MVTTEAYTYTENGQQATVTDANGQTTAYTYDGLDRLATTTYADGSEEQQAYDAAGNLVNTTNRAGETINYAYDALHRQTRKTLPGVVETEYRYLLTGRLRLAIQREATDIVSRYVYAYDTASRLKTVTNYQGEVVGYEYDAAGNRTKLSYPDNYYVSYEYDALNRLDQVIDNDDTTVLADYDYNALSQRTALTYANGTSVTYQYEIDGDMTELNHQLIGYNPVYRYTYNQVHQMTRQANNNDVSQWSPPVGTTTYESANPLNQYPAINSVTQTYDSKGNLDSNGEFIFAYDEENKLISADKVGLSVTYGYDANGQRQTKTVDNTATIETTRYLYDGAEVLMEYDEADNKTARYVYGPGIDQPILREDAYGNRDYYHFDQLGTVVALSGGNIGTLTEQYAYGPFGESTDTSATGNTYRYTGRRLDEETGLYYYRARYYDPGTGRFLQTDPIGYVDSLNLYSYVLNDPVNLKDPSGEVLVQATATIGGGVLGGFIQTGTSLITQGRLPTAGEFTGAVIGGATAGLVLSTTLNPAAASAAATVASGAAAGALGGAVGSSVQQRIDNGSIDLTQVAKTAAVGATVGAIVPGVRISGITKGRNSFEAVTKSVNTKLANGTISNVSAKTVVKGTVANMVRGSAGGVTVAAANGAISAK